MSDSISLETVAGFMANLRDAGFEAKHLIRKAIGEENVTKRQFVIAMFASKSEILSNDFRAIVYFTRYLLKCNDNDKFQAWERYILNKRTITLLNLPLYQKHGEARLLDSDDTIRSEVLQQKIIMKEKKEENYLSKMKESFYLQFGKNEAPVLLMFSYLIPCTLESHKCARLISEYSKRNSEIIFVAFQTLFEDTDTDNALAQMADEKVKVVPKKYIDAFVNTEISQLLAPDNHHGSTSTYRLPKGRLTCHSGVGDFAYKQLIRKTQRIERRNGRKFEETMPYRVCKNRKSHKSSKKASSFLDNNDDYSIPD